MKLTEKRLKRLAETAKAVTPLDEPQIEVWSQDMGGEDAFTCPLFPGVTRTLAEVEAAPPPESPSGAITRILVCRYDARESE